MGVEKKNTVSYGVMHVCFSKDRGDMWKVEEKNFLFFLKKGVGGVRWC